MRKRVLPVLGVAATTIVVVSMAFGSVASAHPDSAVSPGATKTLAYHPDGTACYSQMTDDQGDANAVIKLTDEPTLNSKGADDFTLTSACTVSEIDVAGGYYGWPGPAAGFNITLYKDSGTGVPGKVVKNGVSRKSQYTYQDSGSGINGDFYITLNKPKTLQPGTYWVGVQADMTESTTGFFYWDGDTVQTGSAAVWKNPRQGFGEGCATWTPVYQCAGVGPDMEFAVVSNS